MCPTGAITENRTGGAAPGAGAAGAVQFVSGTLDVGESSSPPVIRAAKHAAPDARTGRSSMPARHGMSHDRNRAGCDYLLLVTEPTPFGLHDLRLAVETARALTLPCGVVVNRASTIATETRAWCQKTRIPILAEIPDSLAIAKAYSRGRRIVDTVPGIQNIFGQLAARLQIEVRCHA